MRKVMEIRCIDRTSSAVLYVLIEWTIVMVDVAITTAIVTDCFHGAVGVV